MNTHSVVFVVDRNNHEGRKEEMKYMEEKVLSLEDKVEDRTAECTKAKKAMREISYLGILLNKSR
jgi:hypothetical protein